MSTCLLITTYNRTHLLRNSFHRLAGRTLPSEILVVDDGGSDGCRELCQKAQEQSWFSCPVRYIYNHNREDAQCSLARNIGIRNTDADLIITAEPELMFETDVISQMLALHELNPDCVISAGTIEHVQEDGSRMNTVGWVATFAALYGRQWLIDVGGWDEEFPDPWGWEDTDLLTRLSLSGHGQVIANEIVAIHQWHQTRYCRQDRNEPYFRGKGFNEGRRDLVVANQGREWGKIKA